MAEPKTMQQLVKSDAWDDNYDDEWAFGEDDIYDIPRITWSIWPTANQWKNTETKSWCTMVWAISQIQRLFQLDLSMEERNKLDVEIVKWCTSKWYVIWEWWSSYTACINVVKRWNEYWYKRYNTEKVFYSRKLWNNPVVLEALSKWHLVWYTKSIQFWTDQVSGYVWRDKYPTTTWHRLNLKWVEFIPVATGWATKQDAIYWSQDNYHWQIGENFYIKDIKPYINNWLYAYMYIILPESALSTWDTEKAKQLIAETKATNALIWVMTSTWADVPEKYQKMSANYASELRKDYEWARPLYKDQEHKVTQSVVDMLSYSYKYVNEKYQKKFADLAAEMRKDFGLK